MGQEWSKNGDFEAVRAIWLNNSSQFSHMPVFEFVWCLPASMQTPMKAEIPPHGSFIALFDVTVARESQPMNLPPPHIWGLKYTLASSDTQWG